MFWIGITVILVIGIAGSVLLYRKAHETVQPSPLEAMLAAKLATPVKPRQAKCHIRTGTYRNGHQQVVHTICDNLDPSAVSDEYLQSQYTKSKLIGVEETIHYVG